MKKVYICIPIVIIALSSLCFAGYRPVIVGDFETGDRLYTDFMEYNEEEIIDQYHYNKYWLKYKKKLSVSDYYYLKYQYYEKRYEIENKYNNICYNIWGNYTYRIDDKLRNKFNISYKNKDYLDNINKSYNSLRLKYKLDYDPDSKNNYQISFQRQWNDYFKKDINNNTKNRISIDWEYDINADLEINTNIQLKNQLYNKHSQRSNKYNHVFSLGFKYKL